MQYCRLRKCYMSESPQTDRLIVANFFTHSTRRMVIGLLVRDGTWNWR